MELLDYLLAHALAPDPRTARGLIMRGDVLVQGRPVTSPHAKVAPGVEVRVRGKVGGAVSRGALKLRPVMHRAGFECANLVCLDLGVATGGFTQVLLESGASRVYAVDVAYGTIALEIRNDPRVVLLERTNARLLTSKEIPEPIERVVGDLSFIGWGAVLPAVAPLLAPGAELLLLVKPQFELAASGGSRELIAGVALNASAVRRCLESLYNTWVGQNLSPQAVIPAAVRGAKGNQEYFVRLKSGAPCVPPEEYSGWVAAAIEEAGL
jgi:23S rRNA (cytidine1920-2'-O)/16S rRNA (cytidine1409-2'-O)-methyltransferase